MLKKISKKEEVTEGGGGGECCILMGSLTRTLSRIILGSRSLRWAGHALRSRKTRNAYTNFVGKPEKKR